MKHFIGLGICAALLVGCGDDKKEQDAESQTTEAAALDMSDPETRLNYAIGMGAGLSHEELAGFLNIDKNQLDAEEALKGFEAQLKNVSQASPEKSQEVMGALVKRLQNGETLSEEEFKELSYAQGVLLAAGAVQKMEALQVKDKMNADVMVLGATHQFKGEPTSITKADMEELLSNLERDRSQQQQAQMPAAPDEPTVVGSIDDYSEDQKASYVLGMNNGWMLKQSLVQLPPAFAQKIDLELLISTVEDNMGTNAELDQAAFQQTSQTFFSYKDKPDEMPEQVSEDFTKLFAVSLTNGVEEQKKLIDGVALNKNTFVEGISDVLLKNEAKLSLEDMNSSLTQLASKKGELFLEENAKKPGVKTTASGLQYKVLKKGEGGPKPTPTDKVTAHYIGKLTDGTVFQSSYDMGKPIDFAVTGVIKGWTEGLQLMSVGDKYELYIPQHMAYGSNPPQGSGIPPYEALVFEIELVAIK